MKRILTFCLIITSLNCYAQMGKTLSYGEHDYINKSCKAGYPNQPLNYGNGSEQDAVVNFVYKQTGHFTDDNTGVTIEKVIKGPYSRHYTFHQTYAGGIEVYNSQIKVNVDNAGNVRSIFDNSFDVRNWSKTLAPEVHALDSQSITRTLLGTLKNIVAVESRRMIFADTTQPVAAMYYMVRTMRPGRQWEYIVGAGNNILYKRDLTMYYNNPGDSLVNVKVYYPDPITSGHTTYDTVPYFMANNNYLDSKALTDQEFSKTMRVHYDDTTGTFTLYNANYIAGHTQGSLNAVIPQVPTTDSNFIFTRDNTINGFLYSNTFFWLNTMRAHIDSLGYGASITPAANFDPMADSSDNSDYLYGDGIIPNWFEFGIGGVPDAQDADVILHEHGHFVSYCLAPNSANGFERLSVDEGQADYWAASYSRYVNTYQADWVFNWDGHNEFWPGRICNTTAIYKNQQTGWSTTGIHTNGQIWSTCMMDIWKQYGREVADKLELQANLSFAQNQTMPQCALLVKQADSILYAGVHANAICTIFQNRGLLNGLCELGDTASPYHVVTTLQIYNTGAFANNTGNAYINSNILIKGGVGLKMYDINGNLLWKSEYTSGGISFPISPKYLSAGVYIISVTSPNVNKVFKVVKLKD